LHLLFLKSDIRAEFKNPDTVNSFLEESSAGLVQLYKHKHPEADHATVTRIFRNAPVVPLSYSGGYTATAQTLTNPRVKGVVMLDSMYGHARNFADFIKREDGPFVAVTFGPSTIKATQEFLKEQREGSAVIISSPIKADGHWTLVETALGDKLRALSVTEAGKVSFTEIVAQSHRAPSPRMPPATGK
jgi:hypothetical protein